MPCQHTPTTRDTPLLTLNTYKWATTISERVAAEAEALTLDLVRRIQQLGERYGETLEDLDTELSELEKRVAAHLANMGVK